MAVVAGIDEAGFGPVLGPLVVSAAVFEVPDAGVGTSMWRLLAGCVRKKPSKRSGAVAIGDSKKLYSRQRAGGLEHLERGVLALLATRRNRPDSLKKLLSVLAPAAGKHAAMYPWYSQADVPLPQSISPTDVALTGNALKVGFSRAGVELVALRSEPIFVGEYNRVVQATKNKSTTLFDVTSRLIMHLWHNAPAGPLHIYVDRHGGRKRYLPALQRLFAGGSLKVIDETDTFSAYRIADARRTGQISFSVGAEEQHLPVALASMTSKYVRELFMEMFNRFWAGHVADLKPTAGYYVDGRRFYSQILPAVRRLGYDRQQLYRCR